MISIAHHFSPRRGRALGAVALTTLAALGVVAGPAQAATYTNICGNRVTNAAFTQFGDAAEYFAAPDGGFEGRGTGWTRVHTSIVSENEPWYVGAATDVKALRMASYSTATTPAFCTAASEEAFRFFYRAPGKPGYRLTVTATVTSAKGTASVSTKVDGSISGWQVSPPLALPDLLDSTGTQYVTIRIDNNSDLPFMVDDLLVDPWRSL
jgi:hypothetical protein